MPICAANSVCVSRMCCRTSRRRAQTARSLSGRPVRIMRLFGGTTGQLNCPEEYCKIIHFYPCIPRRWNYYRLVNGAPSAQKAEVETPAWSRRGGVAIGCDVFAPATRTGRRATKPLPPCAIYRTESRPGQDGQHDKSNQGLTT